ncbi:hypothetical protein RB213_013558 [Colletotrichum asianum]
MTEELLDHGWAARLVFRGPWTLSRGPQGRDSTA